jgi:hypothetical protein
MEAKNMKGSIPRHRIARASSESTPAQVRNFESSVTFKMHMYIPHAATSLKPGWQPEF